MDRRNFLKISAGLSFAAHFTPVFARSKTTKPNLLIIHTDEHNFRTLGCYRKLMSENQAFVWGKGIKVDTPNIDWIADNGAICTSFYATTPVCSPSRSSFLSGKYPQNTPVFTNDIPMNDDIITFAHVLSENGYSTGYSGKWHLDGKGKPQWQPKRKFGFSDNRYMFNRGHWKKLEDTPNGPRVAARKNGKPNYSVDNADKKTFTTDYLANKTIDFINQHSREPFCYMVSIPDPHGPNTVRTPYDTMYDDLEFELPETAKKSDKGLPSWAKKIQGGSKMKSAMMAKYFGMVKCIDDNVGRILNALRTNDIIDNTIIVFTADHGDMCFEHGRHNKGIPLESSAKIPFAIHYPARIKNGTVINEAMGCVDFMPTILKLMDVRSPGVEGRDCSQLFVKGKSSAGWNDIIFFRGTGNNDTNWIAAATKQYKIVYKKGEESWLYDLENDPDELVNFYKDKKYAVAVKKMSTALIAYGKKYNDPRADESLIR